MGRSIPDRLPTSVVHRAGATPRYPTRLFFLSVSLVLVAVVLAVPSAIAGGHGFQREDAIATTDSQDHVAAAVVAQSGDYAYFGTDTSPGQIVKVDLATFERVDTITLDPGENDLRTAVIDGDHAYFGTDTAPGRVVKVDLTTFSRVGAVTLDSGEDGLHSAVIDPSGDFAYFGTNTSPGRVVKVDVGPGTFARDAAIILDGTQGENLLTSAVMGRFGEFAYFGTDGAPGRVVKVELRSFIRDSAIAFGSDESNLTSAVIEPASNSAYFGTGTSPGRVVKVDLDTFARVDAIIVNAGENSLRSAVIGPAGRYAYFGTNDAPGRVVKVDIGPDTFAEIGDAITLNTGEDHLHAAVIAGGAAYFGTNTVPGHVVKVDLATFTRDAAITLSSVEEDISSAVIDPAGDYAYFGTDTTPGKIVKVDLATFTRVDAITLGAGEDHLTSAVMDPSGNHAYFGTDTSPGQVVRVDLGAFARVDAITLTPGENQLFSAVMDPLGDFAYFGTRTAPGRVVKVDLTTFGRDSAITLNPGEDELVSAVIAPTGSHAYFGNTSTNPGKVVKVDLGAGTFARVDAVTLANDEAGLWAATIDPTGDYAYFGTISNGPVIKVDLGTNTFGRDSAITLDPGEEMMTSAVMDPSGDFAYFGTSMMTPSDPGRVVKIDVRAGTFARVDAVTLDAGENSLWSAVIDPTGDYAYFGTETSPGRVVKVALVVSPPDVPTNLTATAGDTEVDLTWDAPTTGGPVDDYLVEQSADGGITWTTGATTAATAVIVTGLTNGTTYDFRVRAQGPGGNSAWTGPVSATPQGPPHVPTNLTATAGDTEVDLTWDAPTTGGPVDDYLVEQSADGGITWTTGATTAATAVIVTGLTNGTTYDFRVRAQGPGGNSAWTGPVSATPQTPPPDVPTSLAATPGDTEVDLTWDAPTTGGPVTNYRVRHRQWITMWNTWWSWQAVGTPIATSVTATGLTNGATYQFDVRAEGPGGNSAWAGPVSASPQPAPPPPPPHAPTNLTAAPGDSEVDLIWDAPTTGGPVTKYRVQRQYLYLGFVLIWAVDVGTPTATSVTATGLTNGTNYPFRVRAEGPGGNSAWTGPVSATPQVPPHVPTNLTATGGDTEVDLTWDAPTTGGPVDDYLVEQSADGGITWTTGATAAATAVIVTGLTNGTTYDFRVRAQGPGGNSAWAGPVSATPQTPPPDVPTSLAATPGDTEVDLTWDAPTTGGPVTNYRVDLMTMPPSTIATTAATELTVTGLTNGTTYPFRVRAEGPGGNSAWVGPVSATPQSTSPPPAPASGLTASAGTGPLWTTVVLLGASGAFLLGLILLVGRIVIRPRASREDGS